MSDNDRRYEKIGKVTNWDEPVNERFGEVGKDVDTVEELIDALDDDIQSVDDLLEALESDVETLENKTSGLSEDGTEADLDLLNTDYTQSVQVDRHKVDGRWGERFTGHGTMLDNFEDLTDWSAGSGSLEADTNRFHRGTQSAHLQGTGDGSLMIENGTYSLDLTNKRLSMACWLEDPDPANITIIVDDSTGSTAYFNARYTGAEYDSVGWRYLDFTHSAWIQEDTDLSDIDNIRIHTSRDVNDLWVDGLKTVPSPDTGKLVLGFDDGNPEDLDMAAPILSEHGYTATSWVNTDYIGDSGNMTLDQLEELRDKYGWTIASHLHEHNSIPGRPAEEQRALIEGAVAWLQEHGFHEGARHLAWPANTYDQQAYEMAQEYHQTARFSGNAGMGYPLNPMSLPGFSGDGGLSDIQEELDFLADYGGVGILYWHSSSISESDFRTIVEEIYSMDQAGDIDVIGIDDLRRSLSAWHTQ